MSDLIPKAGGDPKTAGVSKPSGVKIGGLSRQAQKLQAAREKAANVKSGTKPLPGASMAAVKAKTSFTGKKTSFQRKAV